MKTLIASFALASTIVGCIPNESPDGAGGSGGVGSFNASTGSINPGFGRSRVIDSFQAARRAALTDQSTIDVVDAQTATAAMVDVSTAAEAARVFYVLDWTIDVMESTAAKTCGVVFDQGAAPRSQENAERASTAFEIAVSDVLYKLPAPKWNHEWFGYVSDSLDAQVAIDRPEEWDHIVYTATRGTHKCMQILAIKSGAETMAEALAAVADPSAQLVKSGDDAFFALTVINGK